MSRAKAAQEKEPVESITPQELAHLKKVNQDVANADAIFNQAAANLNRANGSKQGFYDYLVGLYKLVGNDSVNLETGAIKRVK
jgi:hypothetical protein